MSYRRLLSQNHNIEVIWLLLEIHIWATEAVLSGDRVKSAMQLFDLLLRLGELLV